MPEILYGTNKVAVAPMELVPDWYSSLNYLSVVLSRFKDKNYGIKRLGGKACKGKNLLIDFDTLKPEIKEKLGDPRKVSNPIQAYYSLDGRAVHFYQNYTLPNGDSLSPAEILRYPVNASVMNAVMQLHDARLTEWASKNKSSRGILTSLAYDLQAFKETMKTLNEFDQVHNIPTSRHFKKIFKEYRSAKTPEDAYTLLIKDINRKSAQAARKLGANEMALLEALFTRQKHKPSPQEISYQYEAFKAGELEVISRETGELYNPDDFNDLGDSTIRNYYTTWRSKTATVPHRMGDRQKRDQMMQSYHSFKMPTMSGSMISVDDRQPPFEYQDGQRMWFYNGIDLASEAFTVWVYGKSKKGIIKEFYRQMVRNYHALGINLPRELEGEMSLNSSFRDSFLTDGGMFERVNLYANKARSKNIEGYYKKLRYGIEKKREGWLARPFALSEPNQPSPAGKTIVPYDKLAEQCVADIMKWNNMPHSKYKDISRWDYFLQNQNPDALPTNYRGILPHIGHHTQSSCSTGIVNLNYGKYLLAQNDEIQTGEGLISLMEKVEGKSFDIYWLDGTQGEVIKALVYLDGRYICELMPKPEVQKAHFEKTDEDWRGFHLMERYKQTIDQYIRLRKNAVEDIAVIDNRKETISDSFHIPGLTSPTNNRPSTDQGEVLADYNDENEFSNPSSSGSARSWKEKYSV